MENFPDFPPITEDMKRRLIAAASTEVFDIALAGAIKTRLRQLKSWIEEEIGVFEAVKSLEDHGPNTLILLETILLVRDIESIIKK